jgi:hypothetical protein
LGVDVGVKIGIATDDVVLIANFHSDRTTGVETAVAGILSASTSATSAAGARATRACRLGLSRRTR